MSRLDALPADQKSVLQLLLRQGKGYDDLSGLLRLDADEVRSRAYDALDTLGPGAGGLSTERRHEIADWLLGQRDPEEAAATRAFVDGSKIGRDTSELQSHVNLVCRLLLEKKKKKKYQRKRRQKH